MKPKIKMPLIRMIRDLTVGTCPECGSTEKWWFGYRGFGKILGCIQPKCCNYYKGDKK